MSVLTYMLNYMDIACIYVFMCVYKCMNKCVYKYVCSYIYKLYGHNTVVIRVIGIATGEGYGCTYIFIYGCMYTYVFMFVCMYEYIYLNLYVRDDKYLLQQANGSIYVYIGVFL